METEIVFVGATDEMVNTARALGIGRGGEPIPPLCPYQVGDLISYPAVSALAFRVSWRLFSHPSETKPGRWILGIEKAVHPLAPSPSDAPPRG